MSEELSPNEQLSRFLYKGEYDAGLNVKGKAFTPKKGESALSVCRVGKIVINEEESSLTEREIWILGHEKVGAKGSKQIEGRTDFNVEHVLSCNVGLAVKEHSDDFDRHAHVEPWPVLADDADEETSNRFYAKRETMRNKLAKGLKAKLIPETL